MSTTTKPKTRKAKKSVLADAVKKLEDVGSEPLAAEMNNGSNREKNGVEGTPVITLTAEKTGKESEGESATGAAEVLRARAREFLKPWQQRFCDALSKCPVVLDACVAGNVSRQLAYQWREKDELFRAEWDAALEEGWDKAEKAAYTRGVQGVPKPIFNRDGEVIAEDMQYSDRLLEFVLKGNRAKVYREKQEVDVTHGISRELSEIIRGVRMRRQGENGRELPAP